MRIRAGGRYAPTRDAAAAVDRTRRPLPSSAESACMIRADIAIAALDDDTAQRLRIAATLLAAYRIRAVVRDWDGTRCNVLVADHADTYGRQAYEIARRRETPVLLFNPTDQTRIPGVTCADPASVASTLAVALRDLLGAPQAETPATAAQAAPAASPATASATAAPAAPSERTQAATSALCRLTSPEFEGRPVDATLRGRTLHIRPAQGRIYAPSLSDLLSARDSLGQTDWTLQTVAANDRSVELGDGVSRSLEAFLLQAAFQSKTRLPEFPPGRYRLRDWPDIGSAPELIGALKIANALLRGAGSAEQLAAQCDLPLGDVNAALWAYRAAGLLETEGSKGVFTAVHERPQDAGRLGGLLARIASHFGLSRAS